MLHDRPLILDHTHTPRTLDTMSFYSIVRQHSMVVQPRQQDTDGGHDSNLQLIELHAATQRPHSIVLPVSTENGLWSVAPFAPVMRSIPASNGF